MAAVAQLIQARRARTDFLSPDLFSDPAWDILLILFHAKLRGDGVTSTTLGDAISQSTSTSDRWIKVLEHNGLVRLKAGPCAEATRVELSARGTSALWQWVELWLVGQSDGPRAPVMDLFGRIYGGRDKGRWP
jgi:hypothetical protein